MNDSELSRLPRPSPTPVLVVTVLVVLLLVPPVRRAAHVNAASARYGKVAAALTAASARVQPPNDHPRGALWAAIRALEADNASAALAWAQPWATNADPLGLEVMGRAYEQLADFPAATQVWRRAGSATALLRVAKSAREQGATTAARQAYQAVWELDPHEGTLPLASFLASEMDDPAAAEDVLRQTLADYCPCPTRRPYYLRSLAQALADQDRWAEAAELYDQHLIAYPYFSEAPDGTWSPSVYDSAAWAYHQSGQTEKAVAALEKALSIGSAGPDLLIHAGHIYEAAGQTQKALTAYRQVLAVRPNDKTAQTALQRLATDH